MPKLSILIPAFNEAPFLAQTLQNLRAGLAAAEIRDWEIILCDNNSTDDTARIAREAGVQVVFEPHNQISRSRNRAAREATGEWLLFLDADTKPPAALLGAMWEKMQEGRICGGGALLEFDERLGVLLAALHGFWNMISRRLNLAAGCFLFCRREGWRATGGFDEKLYAGEEIFFVKALRRWAKGEGFIILDGPKVITSARKFKMFSTWTILGQVAILCIPGALRFRRFCTIWYKRDLP